MALRYHRHRKNGGGFIGIRTTPLPPPQPPTHRTSSSVPALLDHRISLLRQYPNRSTVGGPLHIQRLGIGAPINDDANAPLTPRLAQLSGDGGRRCGVPRVFGSGGSVVWGRLRRTAEHFGTFTEAGWDLVWLYFLCPVQSFLFNTLPGETLSIQYHFQGWKTQQSLDLFVHSIVCKGVMIP